MTFLVRDWLEMPLKKPESILLVHKWCIGIDREATEIHNISSEKVHPLLVIFLATGM